MFDISTPVSRFARAHRHLFVTLVTTVSIVLWAGAGVSAWLLRDVMTGLPDQAAIKNVGAMAQATTLLDIEGRHAFTIFKEQRIEVPLSRVSPNLVKAIISIEDQRFYDHGGIDVFRVAGAALSNLRAGRAAQGGSTITQQLARQSFLSPDKTMRRKLKEMMVAARLEREFTKDQILEMYLNKVYLGDGLYGVEAASLGYFGKHAAELDVAEAALLAGLVKSPSAYAPTVNDTRARTRRNVVLQAMRDAATIDAGTYAAAVDRPVVLTDGLRRAEGYGQYFKEEVRKELVDRFGWERVYQGGLRVYTTIDLDMQQSAEQQIREGLQQIDERRARQRRDKTPVVEDPLQGALVALDPSTGEVRALVGGRDFDDSHFDRAVQAKRQPGSAFKPFVYAAALEQGYSPASLISGLNDPVMTVQGAWVPEDEHLDGDAITMRSALRSSSNRAAVRVLQEVGINTTVQYAERLGVGEMPRVPSLALGSGEVTLLSMTSAFGAFANQGVVVAPHLIRRVEAMDGEMLYTEPAPSHRAVSEATAFMMASMMSDVINSGTAWQARRLGFKLPAAGKTGTTNDYKDAWFVGFTPSLVAGVWVGFDQPRTIMRGGYAAELAVPIWAKFMTAATEGDEAKWLSPPATVTSVQVCRISGKRALPGCEHAQVVDADGNLTFRSQVYTEYFARGAEPEDYCPIHLAHPASNRLVADIGPPPSPVRQSSDVRAVVAPARPATTATVGERTETMAETKQPEPQGKRGFWSRIFGRRDKDESKR